MSINPNAYSIANDLNNIIASLNSSQPENQLTSKVHTILTDAQPFSEEPTVKKLLLQLESSLNSHNLKELGELR